MSRLSAEDTNPQCIDKRRGRRYPLSIPVMMYEGDFRVTGMTENLSAFGALVTDVSERPDVGTIGRFRLMALRSSLHTTGPNSLELVASVVRRQADGFAVEFLGSTERLRGLLDRALSRGVLSDPDR